LTANPPTDNSNEQLLIVKALPFIATSLFSRLLLSSAGCHQEAAVKKSIIASFVIHLGEIDVHFIEGSFKIFPLEV